MAVPLFRIPAASAHVARRLNVDGDHHLEVSEFVEGLAASTARFSDREEAGHFDAIAGKLAMLTGEATPLAQTTVPTALKNRLAQSTPVTEQQVVALLADPSLEADERAAAEILASRFGLLVGSQAMLPERPAFAVLDSVQRHALTELRLRAARNAAVARPRLLERLKTFGYSEADLDNVLAHFRDDVRIQVQFGSGHHRSSKESVVESLAKDPYFRNQFEVGVTSSGQLSPFENGARDQFEDKVFQGAYHGGELIPSQRPKYAWLNYEQSTDARSGGAKYGDTHFPLVGDIRERLTVTPMDSELCTPEQVGTLDHLEHVLDAMIDVKLRELMEAGLGRPSGSSGYGYMEAQIHGPVDLRTDTDEFITDVANRNNASRAHFAVLEETLGHPVLWRNAATGEDER